MGLDRVDIALIHDPDDHYESAIAGAYVALERLRSEGVVNAIGVGMNQTELLVRFARESDIDCFLVAGRYTLLDRSAPAELFPLCVERGIAVIAAGVFNSGILAAAGAGTFDYRPAPAHPRACEELRRACERHTTPLAAAAIQFPLRHPAVTTVLVGCRSAAEIAEDAHLRLELPHPSAELWSELEAPVIVDAHHHLWDPATADYPWMTDEMAPLRRRFEPKIWSHLRHQHASSARCWCRLARLAETDPSR